MKAENAMELFEKMSGWLEDLEAGSLTLPEANGRFNGAGKMISLLKTQCVYSALRNEEPHIPFMLSGDKKSGKKRISSGGKK